MRFVFAAICMAAIADAKFGLWKGKHEAKREERREKFLKDLENTVDNISETIVDTYNEIVSDVPQVPNQWQADVS